jgi:hypothetical protein
LAIRKYAAIVYGDSIGIILGSILYPLMDKSKTGNWLIIHWLISKEEW